MTRRLLSLSIVGALALSAVPAFAEESAGSESSSSVNSSAESSETASSVSSSSVGSSSSARNLGQSIKNKCNKLNGKSRVLCLKETKLTDRKLPPKMMMKKVMKKKMAKNCRDYTKGSDEFKACVGEQKEINKDQSSKAEEMFKKMLMHKKGMGSASSAS